MIHSNPVRIIWPPFTSYYVSSHFNLLHFAYLFLDAAALNHGEIDDDFTVARMILSGVPLYEPYLQYRLSELAKEERKALKGGKLPICESFYLMGTTDPTGILKSQEVCVILYVYSWMCNAIN